MFRRGVCKSVVIALARWRSGEPCSPRQDLGPLQKRGVRRRRCLSGQTCSSAGGTAESFRGRSSWKRGRDEARTSSLVNNADALFS